VSEQAIYEEDVVGEAVSGHDDAAASTRAAKNLGAKRPNGKGRSTRR
jgi:hypothetical protein